MVIIDIAINVLLSRVTRHPAGMHCPSWDDAFVSSSRWLCNPWTVCFPGLLLPGESNFPQSMHSALLASVWPKFGTSQRNFDRLQHLQNNMARVVLQAPARASATDLRRELHWLPIEELVKFKITTLTFKAKCGVPDYLCSLLTDYQPTRTLRSSVTGLLYRPRTSSDFESYCFTSAAPTIWNSLSVTTDG